MSTIITNPVNKNLKFVDNLSDYDVHHEDTDIRDYNVVDASGAIIGEVEGLLADVSARLVRYAEIEIEDDVIERHRGDGYDAEDRNLLIPIGLVQINDNKTVTVRGINMDRFLGYPRFNRKLGYTTAYEIDTNDYLSDFHEYRASYKKNRYSNDKYRSMDTLEDNFYNTDFYTRR